MDNLTRMHELIAQLEELDPEHGDSNVLANFLQDTAPDEWFDDENFDIFQFRDDHADNYVELLEDYIADYFGGDN